jgi:LysM repeat protein
MIFRGVTGIVMTLVLGSLVVVATGLHQARLEIADLRQALEGAGAPVAGEAAAAISTVDTGKLDALEKSMGAMRGEMARSLAQASRDAAATGRDAADDLTATTIDLITILLREGMPMKALEPLTMRLDADEREALIAKIEDGDWREETNSLPSPGETDTPSASVKEEAAVEGKGDAGPPLAQGEGSTGEPSREVVEDEPGKPVEDDKGGEDPGGALVIALPEPPDPDLDPQDGPLHGLLPERDSPTEAEEGPPSGDEAAAAGEEDDDSEKAGAEKEGPAEYTVQRGDTISEIAQKFDVDTKAILKANNISDPRRIQIGQKLEIPQQ